MRTILIVDGICTRGLAIIRYLSSTGEYHILVFSRNTTCSGATAASALPNVTLLLNRCGSGYDLSTFIAATQRCPSVLICSNAGNSESREGVQWGARLVQSAASAGAKHLVYLTAERERKQCSTDNFIHGQSKTSLAWTIIRSCLADASTSGSEKETSISTQHLRNLAYYVTWTFSHPERSSGLDFAIPTATETNSSKSPGTGEGSKRRDSRLEGVSSPTRSQPRVEGTAQHPASQHSRGSSSTARPAASRTGSSAAQATYLDSGRARAIRQWVAKTSPAPQASGQGDEDDEEDEESKGESSSESE